MPQPDTTTQPRALASDYHSRLAMARARMADLSEIMERLERQQLPCAEDFVAARLIDNRLEDLLGYLTEE